MRTRRRRRGFEAGGSFSPELLGLSVGRSRELALHRGWQAIVGPMSERIRLIDLRRGVLRLEIDDSAGDEVTALFEMLPTLVGRLAAICPRLGIRRFRVAGPDGDRGGPVKPIEIPADRPSRTAAGDRPMLERDSGDAATRLTRIMQRCLARTQKP